MKIYNLLKVKYELDASLLVAPIYCEKHDIKPQKQKHLQPGMQNYAQNLSDQISANYEAKEEGLTNLWQY